MKKITQKITQKRIAEESNISVQYINYILNGKRLNLSVKIAKKLSHVCKELGIDISAEDWVFRPREIKRVLKEEEKEENELNRMGGGKNEKTN